MKAVKKIAAVVMALCIILGSVTINGEYSDVLKGESYYPAVSLLTSLGIVKGYEDGTFLPDNNITRAEFTVMLMRAMNISGMNANDLENIPFSDVESVKDWAGGDIKTAHGLGIINGTGAGIFEPDAQVTYEQAIKMIVCALGYESVASSYSDGNPWPYGYIYAASSLKIDYGVKVSVDAPAKRWEIAVMIFNALDVKIMKGITGGGMTNYTVSDETLLKDRLNVQYAFGDIIANDKQSVESGKLAKKGEVLIRKNGSSDLDVYQAGNTDTTDLVGTYVKYYYTEDNSLNRTLVHMESKTKEESVLKILKKDISGDVTGDWESGFDINYYKDESSVRATTLKLEGKARVSVNGRAIAVPTADDLIPESGYIEVIDSRNSGDYDTVRVTSFATYVVSTVNPAEGRISDLYRDVSKNRIIIADVNDAGKKVSVYNGETGETMEVSAIAKNNVLSVKESKSTEGKDVMEIYVSTASVSGTVTAMAKEEGEIYIDDEKYIISEYFKNHGEAKYLELNVSDIATFYLDINKEICSYEKGGEQTTKYGYLAAAKKDDSTGGLVLNIIPVEENAVAQSFKSASRVSLDGVSMSDSENILNELIRVSTWRSPLYGEGWLPGEFINVDDKPEQGSQLIRYSVNAAGEVNMIDTVEGRGSLKAFNKNSNSHWNYYSIANSFKDSLSKHDFYAEANTMIVFVPSQSRSMYSDYMVKPFKSSLFDKDDNYMLEAYDVKGTPGIGSVVLVYTDTLDNRIKKKSPVMIVTDIKSVMRDDGIMAQQVTGYLVGKDDLGDEPVTFLTEGSNTMDGIDVGDVIRFATTREGYIKRSDVADMSIQQLVDVSTENIEPFKTDHRNRDIIPDPVEGLPYIYSATLAGTGYDYRVAHGLLYSAYEGDKNVVEMIPVGTRTKEAVDQELEKGAAMPKVVPDPDKLEEGQFRGKYSFTTSKSTRYYTYDASMPVKHRITAHGATLPLSGYPSYLDGTGQGSDETAQQATEVFVFECEAKISVIYIIKR